MIESTSALDLVQREIDAENTPAESAELRRRMAGDPQLGASAGRLLALSGLLAGVAQEEPPPVFVADVMRAIRARGPRVSLSWIETWRAAFARRPALSYGLSLAAGIVVGALAVGALGPSLLLTRDEAAVGTVLPSDHLNAFREVDRRAFVSEGLRGEVVMRRGRRRVQAEFRIESQRPVQLTVEFDANAFWPLGFERSEAAGSEIVLEPGRVRIAHSGAASYQVFLGAKRPGAAPVSIKVAGEGVLLERRLETGGE